MRVSGAGCDENSKTRIVPNGLFCATQVSVFHSSEFSPAFPDSAV